MNLLGIGHWPGLGNKIPRRSDPNLRDVYCSDTNGKFAPTNSIQYSDAVSMTVSNELGLPRNLHFNLHGIGKMVCRWVLEASAHWLRSEILPVTMTFLRQ